MAPITDLAGLAEGFRQEHHAAQPLVLPNAWSAASARTMVQAGATTLATSSGAIARMLGYPDGERIPAAEMFDIVGRISTAACEAAERDVAVTADLENGYGLDAAELIERVLEAGAVGFNLEDSDPHTGKLLEPDTFAAQLHELRSAADASGVPLVINARVDVFVRQDGPAATRHERAVARARAWLEAGADCVFPIMLTGAEGIRRFTSEVAGPVNIMYRKGTPDLHQLAELGVKRVSFGSGFQQHALNGTAEAVARLLEGSGPWPV